MASDKSSHENSALVADPGIASQSQKIGPAVNLLASPAGGSASLPVPDEPKPDEPEPEPAMSPMAITDTTHAIAPHFALAGAASQAISSPPAAPSSRDTLSSSLAGGVLNSTKSSASSSSKMLFSDLYKSTRSPLSRLRQQPSPQPPAINFDADLLSKDKTKNKEAVKKYLADKIKNDWEFKWPPENQTAQRNGSEVDGVDGAGITNLALDDAKTGIIAEANDVPSHDHEELIVEESNDIDDTASVYSTVSEDAAHYRPRLEWWSDFSDDEGTMFPSAYRFDTPDAVGPSVRSSVQAKRAKRRRAGREEESWNSGLACFNARRDAWTGARTARVKPKLPSTPTSPVSPSRRMSLFRFASTSPPISPALPLSPTATRTSGDTTAVTSSDGDSKENTPAPPKLDSSQYPVEVLLPLAPPLLPPANPMRASITPATYPNLYDRIIVHSLTPSCPVNLADVLRSCVVGWKRDGEWPPRSVDVAPPVVAVRKKKAESTTTHNRRPSTGRRMSLGFLGRRESAAADTAPTPEHAPEDGGSAGKGIRRSLQRVLGIGHERNGSNGSQAGQAV